MTHSERDKPVSESAQIGRVRLAQGGPRERVSGGRRGGEGGKETRSIAEPGFEFRRSDRVAAGLREKQRAARAERPEPPGEGRRQEGSGSAFGEPLELSKGHLRLPVPLKKAAAGVVLERLRERGVESVVHLAQGGDEVGLEGLGYKLGGA